MIVLSAHFRMQVIGWQMCEAPTISQKRCCVHGGVGVVVGNANEAAGDASGLAGGDAGAGDGVGVGVGVGGGGMMFSQ